MSPTSSGTQKVDAITEALLRIVSERGLDHVSVREVAAGADVSIGTVQHYFPTKDAMLLAAYEEVVRRIRSRIQAVRLGADVRRNLVAVLSELLPLDDRRVTECRIHLAFAARAATMPVLAKTQRAALEEIDAGLREAFALAWGVRATSARCVRAARSALATTDGLALHAISSGGALNPRALTGSLKHIVDALIDC